MWSPQILGLNQTVFYTLVGASIVLAALILSLVIVAARRKRNKRPASSGPSQGKIAILVILIVLLATVGAIVVAPYFEIEIGLSVHEINFAMQTLWTALILVGIWFRTKGKYFLHEIIIIAVVFASLVEFFFGTAYVSSEQWFFAGLFQFTFALDCSRSACNFFDFSINLRGMACCTLAPWININCS